MGYTGGGGNTARELTPAVPEAGRRYQGGHAPDILKLDINAWGESWGTIHAMSHEFKTGSTGFYGTGKIINPENPKARYQVCVNITLIGSKLHDRRS